MNLIQRYPVIAVALAICAGMATYVFATQGKGNVAADLVGKWESDLKVDTYDFRADGTYEHKFKDGVTYKGTYELSEGGRRLQMTSDKGEKGSLWRLTFADKDTFTLKEDSIKRLTGTYMRVK